AITYDNPLDLFTGTYPLPAHLARAMATWLAFSLPLLAILLCHELGHYLTARRYNLDVSPPYFIPVPLVPSFIGTMGAFIRLRTMLSDRRQRSEEHTSELQSRGHLVCRLLLEKKK